MQGNPIPVFDGHSDSLLEWFFEGERDMSAFLEGQGSKHMDIVRARAAGMVGGLCAICTPPSWGGHESSRDRAIRRAGGYEVPLPAPLDPEYAAEFGLVAVEAMHALERKAHGRLRVVRTSADLDRLATDETFWIIIHLEGAEPVCEDLSNLQRLYDLGVRSIGPVWSRPNVFGHGVPFKFPSSPDTGPGLTKAGRRLVEACQRLGILVDLSHITKRGFDDVAAQSVQSLVVSHAGAHALCRSARNLTDQQLDTIGRTGGLVGVTFHVADLREDGALNPDTPIDRIVDHIAHIASRIGIEHVALGSDFDGATIPSQLCDASGLPILLGRLKERGFDDDSCRKIAIENWIRVLKAVLGGTGARREEGGEADRR
ncbi:MAG: dipeptidase [candidate division Zixibacteria bacterium]|jgi:membrane dipeptidase|nr:dipeptidase [candidate division Zixibacteria bacterium]